MPQIGNLRLLLITANGFEVPLVTNSVQKARLLRSFGEAHTTAKRRDGDPEAATCRSVRHPRRVPVGELLSRGRLVSRLEMALSGGAV